MSSLENIRKEGKSCSRLLPGGRMRIRTLKAFPQEERLFSRIDLDAEELRWKAVSGRQARPQMETRGVRVKLMPILRQMR